MRRIFIVVGNGFASALIGNALGVVALFLYGMVAWGSAERWTPAWQAAMIQYIPVFAGLGTVIGGLWGVREGMFIPIQSREVREESTDRGGEPWADHGEIL